MELFPEELAPYIRVIGANESSCLLENALKFSKEIVLIFIVLV